MSKRYDALSPDGFPITSKPFASRKEAEAFIPLWCKRFARQGYYAAVGHRIPVAKLHDYVYIREHDEAIPRMSCCPPRLGFEKH